MSYPTFISLNEHKKNIRIKGTAETTIESLGILFFKTTSKGIQEMIIDKVTKYIAIIFLFP